MASTATTMASTADIASTAANTACKDYRCRYCGCY
jgi:hypothetical protein